MAAGKCYAPLLFRSRSFGIEARGGSAMAINQAEGKGLMLADSLIPRGSYFLMSSLQKKMMAFRDFIDLPPPEGDALNELVIRTMWDIQKLYPEIKPSVPMSEMNGVPLVQGMVYFCNCLRSLATLWRSSNCLTIFKPDILKKLENFTLDQNQIGGILLETLDHMIKVAEDRFDMMDTDEEPSSACSSSCGAPLTPTSVLTEPTVSSAEGSAKFSYTPPLLYPLRVQALGKLNPIDVKSLSFYINPSIAAKDSFHLIQKTIEEPKPGPEAKSNSEVMVSGTIKETEDRKHVPPNVVPPGPPPHLPSPPTFPIEKSGNGNENAPPQSMLSSSKVSVPPTTGGAPPPPPPLCSAKSLHTKNASTKLKRSTQMGNLYWLLKGKVEGCN